MVLHFGNIIFSISFKMLKISPYSLTHCMAYVRMYVHRRGGGVMGILCTWCTYIVHEQHMLIYMYTVAKIIDAGVPRH